MPWLYRFEGFSGLVCAGGTQVSPLEALQELGLHLVESSYWRK